MLYFQIPCLKDFNLIMWRHGVVMFLVSARLNNLFILWEPNELSILGAGTTRGRIQPFIKGVSKPSRKKGVTTICPNANALIVQEKSDSTATQLNIWELTSLATYGVSHFKTFWKWVPNKILHTDQLWINAGRSVCMHVWIQTDF